MAHHQKQCHVHCVSDKGIRLGPGPAGIHWTSRKQEVLNQNKQTGMMSRLRPIHVTASIYVLSSSRIPVRPHLKPIQLSLCCVQEIADLSHYAGRVRYLDLSGLVDGGSR